MQVCSIQRTNFQGVFTPSNFNPTPIQKGMINTIKNSLVEDKNVFRKNMNFYNFLESKGQHFMLSCGDYRDEIKVQLGVLKDKTFYERYNLGSYPQNRLDNIVSGLRDKRKELVSNEIWGTATMALLGLGALGLAILRGRL